MMWWVPRAPTTHSYDRTGSIFWLFFRRAVPAGPPLRSVLRANLSDFLILRSASMPRTVIGYWTCQPRTGAALFGCGQCLLGRGTSQFVRSGIGPLLCVQTAADHPRQAFPPISAGSAASARRSSGIDRIARGPIALRVIAPTPRCAAPPQIVGWQSAWSRAISARSAGVFNGAARRRGKALHRCPGDRA